MPTPDLEQRARQILLRGDVRCDTIRQRRVFRHPVLGEQPIAMDYPEGVMLNDRGQGFAFLDHVRSELRRRLEAGEIT